MSLGAGEVRDGCARLVWSGRGREDGKGRMACLLERIVLGLGVHFCVVWSGYPAALESDGRGGDECDFVSYFVGWEGGVTDGVDGDRTLIESGGPVGADVFVSPHPETTGPPAVLCRTLRRVDVAVNVHRAVKAEISGRDGDVGFVGVVAVGEEITGAVLIQII